MLRRTFSHWDFDSVKLAYFTFVRPLLEFAVTVWSPYLQIDYKLLKRVQERATRLAPSLSNVRDYEARLEVFVLSTQTQRRERWELIQIFKIIIGY